MTEPTLQTLVAMAQQLLDAQRETAAEIHDVKLCLDRIENQLADGARRRR